MNYQVKNNTFAAKLWAIRFPDEKSYLVHNLKEFAMTRKLDYQFLISGKVDKGYSARSTTAWDRANLPDITSVENANSSNQSPLHRS